MRSAFVALWAAAGLNQNSKASHWPCGTFTMRSISNWALLGMPTHRRWRPLPVCWRSKQRHFSIVSQPSSRIQVGCACMHMFALERLQELVAELFFCVSFTGCCLHGHGYEAVHKIWAAVHCFAPWYLGNRWCADKPRCCVMILCCMHQYRPSFESCRSLMSLC